MKISYKVPIVASTIVSIAFVIFSAVQYRLTSTNLYNQLNSNMDEHAITLDHQISNWLNGKLALINSMASNEISRGNLEAEIQGVERNDEIGELSKAIQRMQKSLAITLKRLKK